ncbi:S49 family peptidase [Salmonella enterica subsp. enterica]|nr:S49 family peptidase [Salmonella enterica subsp. enterica]
MKNYSRGQYYLASFANVLLAFPQGQVDLSRLRYDGLYYKTLLDKLKVSPTFSVGNHKSAVEPFYPRRYVARRPRGRQPLIGELWQNYAYRFRQSPDFAATTLPRRTGYYRRLIQRGRRHRQICSTINWWTPRLVQMLKKR